MQGRLLTLDTVDDQLIARDFVEELEEEDDQKERKKELQLGRRHTFSRSPSIQSSHIRNENTRSHDSANDTNPDEEEEELTSIQEDHLTAQSGFYVPALFRRWYERSNERRKKQRSRINADEEKANQDGNQTSFRIPSTSSREKYRRTPVFSGTIAPFAIMLEIPGFTSKWYVHITPDGQPNEYRSNPVLLDVGLAFSLASAVVANLAILARFSERMRPRKATAIACTGFIVHDIINLVALIIFGVIHAVDDGFTYSEAYWMTTASTVASICCTISLLVDYIRTKDFKNAGSGLTRKQSQLVIVIMAFLAYISLSALIFALVMQLPFLDAMYFSVESIATIGLGDIVPNGIASKILLFFIAPGGIILLAVMVAIARQTILEEFEDAYKRRRNQYKQKLAERQKERKQHRQTRAEIRSNLSRQMRKIKEGEGKEKNDEMRSRSISRQNTSDSLFTGGPLSRSWTFQSGTNDDDGEDDDGPQESVQQGLTESSGDLSLCRTNSIANSTNATSRLHQFEEDLITQRRDIETRFDQYRKNLAKAQRNEFWLKLSISAFLFACFWLVGAAIFSAIESNWSYFDGFYFVFVVFTSIGYGDFHPTSSSGRAFFIVWALFGVGTLTVLFSVVSDAWGNVIQQRKFRLNKKAHKQGKFKKSMKCAFERILPARVRERRRREKGKAKISRVSAEKAGSPNSTIGILDNDSSSVVVGGILRNSQTPQNDEMSKNEEKEVATTVTKKDTVQMHLELTNIAMEFHKSAIGYMTILREGLQTTIHEIPEIVQALRTLNHSTHEQKVSQEDRDGILTLARSTQEPKVVRALEQTLLVHDFESILHKLIHSSTSFLEELNSRDEELERAKVEIQRLKENKKQHTSDKRTINQIKNSSEAS